MLTFRVWRRKWGGRSAIGGALGGVLGYLGFAISSRWYRTSLPRWSHYVLILLSAGFTWVVYLVTAIGLQMLLGGT